MNTKMFIARLMPVGLLAVTLGNDPVWGQTSTTASANPPGSGGYSIIQRGPHSRVWQNTTLFTDPSGVVRSNIQSYTELCTGVCYVENGEFVDSVEQIDLVGTRAKAVQGPCKVQWEPDASTAGGAVKLTSPGGQQFASRVYGLALRDVSTGSNVLIAQITNSTGVLVGRVGGGEDGMQSGRLTTDRDALCLRRFENADGSNGIPPDVLDIYASIREPGGT